MFNTSAADRYTVYFSVVAITGHASIYSAFLQTESLLTSSSSDRKAATDTDTESSRNKTYDVTASKKGRHTNGRQIIVVGRAGHNTSWANRTDGQVRGPQTVPSYDAKHANVQTAVRTRRVLQHLSYALSFSVVMHVIVPDARCSLR